jgi:dTDP-4-amino-4,6-dideoxygalactose transaminase
MKIGRTLPPAAAPLCWTDIWHGVAGMLFPTRAIRALEEEIRRDFGVRHVFLVSSGTAALTVTLMALKSLRPRTDVVMPAYTCYSVPAAILKARLTPVLCDIDPSTFDFDHGLLEQALNGDTLCVIAHHLFGIPADIERIRKACAARRVFVVEDAAQAMGAESNGCRLGTLGDVGIFSMGRGKNITCGSGGIIVTSSDEIAGAIARQYCQLETPRLADVVKGLLQLVLMAVFIRPRLYWIPAALPFLRLGQTLFPTKVRLSRLSGLKAGVLHNWRRRLARSNGIRCETAAYFCRRLHLQLPPGPSHPYLRLPVLASTPQEKQRIHALSQARGLGLSGAYPAPVSEIPELRAVVNGHRFPHACQVADSLVTIPTHHWLSDNDKRTIADVCREIAHAS